jgi:hypothetical protein
MPKKTNEPIAVALARAMRSVPVPPALLEAEREFDRLSGVFTAVSDRARELRSDYMATPTQPKGEKLTKLDADVEGLRADLRTARAKRRELQAPYLEQLNVAVAPIAAEAAASIIGSINEIRSSCAVISEVAAMLGPRSASPDPHAAGSIGWGAASQCDMRSLLQLEALAREIESASEARP